MDNFSLFGAARWTKPDRSKTYYIAAVSNGHTYERRIVKRRRPYLNGAPLDDTGAEPTQYELRALFVAGPTVSGVPNPSYPNYHRDFIKAIETEGTSTIYIPGRGEKRVRMQKYTTEQVPEARDCEVVTLTYIEDLENERATAGSFSLPSAKSAPPVLARKISGDGNSFGIGGDLFDKIAYFVTRLNAAANAPFDSAFAMQQRVDGLVGLLSRTEKNLLNGPQKFGAGAFSPLAPAEAAGVLVSMAILKDVARRQSSSTYGEGSVTTRRFTTQLSIFEIAAQLGQDSNELITLNARLPSLFAIPAGTPVLVKS